MSSGFLMPDPILGSKDLDDEFITDATILEQYVGNNLFVWGKNGFGQIGNGNITPYSSPIQVGSLTTWKSMAGGTDWTFGIKTDGSLWGCGYNNQGELGKGTSVSNYSSPVQVGTLTNWKQASCGSLHTNFIKTDGTLWGCGYNGQGQLGKGVTTAYSSPIQIGTLTDWREVSSGGSHSLAIKLNGTLWGWGDNQHGSLGNGSTSNYSSPIQIGTLTNWKQVSIGQYHSLGIKTDGSLWACGYNLYGQLGNGTQTDYSSPIQIGTLTNWKQVACLTYSSIAVKTDNTLWWIGGYNAEGESGLNSRAYYSSPIQVGSLTNWKQVAGGFYFTAAVKTDGTLWAWGSSVAGQLGLGNTTYYSSPIQVGSLTRWKSVSCGANHTMAITFTE